MKITQAFTLPAIAVIAVVAVTFSRISSVAEAYPAGIFGVFSDPGGDSVTLASIPVPTPASDAAPAPARAPDPNLPLRWDVYFTQNNNEELNTEACDPRNKNDMGVLMSWWIVRPHYQLALLRFDVFPGGENNGLCGKCIIIEYENTHREVKARIIANCPNCSPDQIELTPAAYNLAKVGNSPRGVMTIGECPDDKVIYPF
ncbi:MAG: hypothetical protein J3R72DRAFT_487783 [Linnemannia gamsii]|nr:MAG: hypothetical protein J3R72DRAFT_487783 [Linnemannia gamsii]